MDQITEKLKSVAALKETLLLFTADAGSALLLDTVKDLDIRAVFIDTGYHFNYTISHVKCLGNGIEIITAKNAVNLPEDGMDKCCFMRKVDPLNQYLEINSFRRLILPFRDEEAYAAIEESFLNGINGGIEIIRPLSSFSEKDVWTEIRARGLQFNELYKKGYRLVDCGCCVTRFGRRKDGTVSESDQMSKETVEKLKALGYM